MFWDDLFQVPLDELSSTVPRILGVFSNGSLQVSSRLCVSKMIHVSLASLVHLVALLSFLQAQDLATRLRRGLAAAQKGECELALTDLRAVVALDPGSIVL